MKLQRHLVIFYNRFVQYDAFRLYRNMNKLMINFNYMISRAINDKFDFW